MSTCRIGQDGQRANGGGDKASAHKEAKTSHDNTHASEALPGGFISGCFFGAALAMTKDLAVDFNTGCPHRGSGSPLSDAVVIKHSLTLFFLELFIEQCQMTRDGGGR